MSPAMSDVSETKTTLNFGLRAMKVTNTAYVNVEVRANPEVKARDVDFCTNQNPATLNSRLETSTFVRTKIPQP